MREKTEKFVITFHTTTEAIAFEKNCKSQGIPGRLIPVPRQISSGCGLAWAMEAEFEGLGERMMEENHMGFESKGIYLV